MKDFSDIIEIAMNEVSGKYAWDWIARISQFNRRIGSKDFHEIVKQIMNELEKYELDELQIHKYPADGKTKTWEYIGAPSWDVKSAELRLTKPKEELICRFQDIPMCVLGYSKSCNVSAELIDVGTGIREEDYEGKDVKGKIVLMSAPKLLVTAQYVEKGALGVIVYPTPEKAAGYRDMTVYNRFPIKADILEKNTFGFSITQEKALYLKDLLKKGPVFIEANINVDVFDENLEVISAAIYGSEKLEEEIILTAHLCHPAPGANDNASGSAGLIELVRALTSLIKKGILTRPIRTIRFLWVPEFDGTFPWAKENEIRVKNSIVNLNLDMIGEDPMKIGEPFEICHAPYSTPSILNDIIRYYTEIIADHPKGIEINGTKVCMKYRIIPFAGGSDHQVFVDTALGIPGIMLNHSDPLWHTSLDTIDNCDPTELKRVIGIAFCIAYFFATVNNEMFYYLIPILERGFYDRLGKTKGLLMKIYNHLNNEKDEVQKEEKAYFGLALIKASDHYEKEILESFRRFGPYNDDKQEILSLKQKEINRWTENQNILWIELCKEVGINIKSHNEPEEFANKWSRAFLGVPNFMDLLSIAMSSQYQDIKAPEPPELWFGDLHEIQNLVGLSYDLKMISAMLSLEYQHLFYPSELNKLMKFLVSKEILKEA
ncbi:MAG: DUF4910 domain-containing protein [Promethearchaeota archaeon]